MWFRRSLFALLVVFSSAIAPTANAQQPAVACDPSNEQSLRTQIGALSDAPAFDTFMCAVNNDVAPGVLNYGFLNDTRTEMVSTIFEMQNGRPVILGVYYMKVCPQKECARGWLSDAFLATGYGNPASAWTSVQEDDPRITIGTTITKAREAIDKRKP